MYEAVLLKQLVGYNKVQLEFKQTMLTLKGESCLIHKMIICARVPCLCEGLHLPFFIPFFFFFWIVVACVKWKVSLGV